MIKGSTKKTVKPPEVVRRICAESYSDQMKIERFFVGSEQELNSSWGSKPKI